MKNLKLVIVLIFLGPLSAKATHLQHFECKNPSKDTSYFIEESAGDQTEVELIVEGRLLIKKKKNEDRNPNLARYYWLGPHVLANGEFYYQHLLVTRSTYKSHILYDGLVRCQTLKP